MAKLDLTKQELDLLYYALDGLSKTIVDLPDHDTIGINEREFDFEISEFENDFANSEIFKNYIETTMDKLCIE